MRTSSVTVARMTLVPLVGSDKFTVVVDEAVEPDKFPLTEVIAPVSGVSCTWIAVPDGRLVPFTTTATGWRS